MLKKTQKESETTQTKVSMSTQCYNQSKEQERQRNIAQILTQSTKPCTQNQSKETNNKYNNTILAQKKATGKKKTQGKGETLGKNVC